MRTISVMTILLPLAALAACGSEESARSTFRQASIDGCMSAASGQPTPAAMANFDWNRLCSCATDKIMDGKSAADLAQLTPDGPGQRQAVEQCVRDMMPGATAGAGNSSAAGNATQ